MSPYHTMGNPASMMKKLKHNFWGLPAIKELQVLMLSVDQVITDCTQIISKYASLCTGLGTLNGDFHLQLQPDAKPFAIYTPRKVLIHTSLIQSQR